MAEQVNDEFPKEPFVSVDIGSYSVKFVYVEQDKNGIPVLKTLANIIVPPFEKNLTEEQREQMSRDNIKEYCLKELRQLLTTKFTELLYDNEIQTKKAVTFASNREVTIRCLEVPPSNEKVKFEESVKQEANKQMPFSMGNAVLGYSKEGEITKDNQNLIQVMAAALQKDTIEIINTNLKGGGLVNNGIITLPQALQIALKAQMAPYAEGDKKVAIIHSGHTTTSVMIFKNNKIRFYRDIHMAGATITDVIFAGGEVDGQQFKPSSYAEATELKHKLGVVPPDDIESLKGMEKFAANKIFETVEKIFQNIQLSISFYTSQSGETSGIDQIILTGGTSCMKNFKEFIEESLEVSTTIANPFESLQIGEIKYPNNQREKDCGALSPVIGVGLYTPSNEIINFLDILFPNRNKKIQAGPTLNLSDVSSKFGSNLNKFGTKLFELDEKKLRILAGMLLALAITIYAIPVININKKLTLAKANFKNMNKQLQKLKGEQSEVDKLLNEQHNLEKFAGVGQEIKEYKISNTKLLIKLLSLVPKEIFLTNAEIDTFSDNPHLELLGHADNSDNVFQFLSELGQCKMFKNPMLKSTQEIEIDESRYFIKFDLYADLNKELLYIKDKTESDEGDEEDIDSEDDFESEE